MSKNLLILGAGQYGQVAKETASAMDCFEKIAFLDDNNKLAVGKIEEYGRFVGEYSHAFVAIGNAELRATLLDKLEREGFALATLVHPDAYVSPSVRLGGGAIIEPRAVVNTHATVEKGAYICAGSIVNHDAIVGECCQIDCGAVIGTGAIVPPKTKIYYNAVYFKEGR